MSILQDGMGKDDSERDSEDQLIVQISPKKLFEEVPELQKLSDSLYESFVSFYGEDQKVKEMIEAMVVHCAIKRINEGINEKEETN